MQIDLKLGTFDDVFANTEAEIRSIAVRLREVIAEIDPECIELPRPGERSVAYGVGPKKMSEAYAYLMPQRFYVNLGFYHGVSLSDPVGLLEGSGKALRHVKIYKAEDVDKPEIRNLLMESMRERKVALGRN